MSGVRKDRRTPELKSEKPPEDRQKEGSADHEGRLVVLAGGTVGNWGKDPSSQSSNLISGERDKLSRAHVFMYFYI